MQARVIEAAATLDAAGPGGPAALALAGERIAGLGVARAPEDVIVLPALVNAHDHARPLRASSIGGFNKPLETWLHRLALFVPVDPHLAYTAAFGRAVLGGQGGAMVHCVRPMGLTDLVTEAREIARAASDIGLRIAFGVGMRDQNPLVYGEASPVLDDLPAPARAEIERRFLGPMAGIDAQLADVDAVAEAIAGPMIDVQYAPNGPQWVSEPFWRRIAEASALTGRRVTTHLFETRYQRDWADRHYPQGLVRHWRDIGLLSPRLTLAHGVHARPDELEMIAESGATIVTNTSSNLALRSGLAPVAEMIRRGCRVAMGIDGQAFDEDDDALREIRLIWSLHGGWGFDPEIAPREVLAMALEAGRGVISAPPGGRLAPGQAADLVVIDRAALDEDRLMALDPLDLLFARATKRHVKEVIVAGRSIVREGRVLGVDLEAAHAELRARYRAGIAGRAELAAALPPLEAAIERHYRLRLGCC